MWNHVEHRLFLLFQLKPVDKDAIWSLARNNFDNLKVVITKSVYIYLRSHTEYKRLDLSIWRSLACLLDVSISKMLFILICTAIFSIGNVQFVYSRVSVSKISNVISNSMALSFSQRHKLHEFIIALHAYRHYNKRHFCCSLCFSDTPVLNDNKSNQHHGTEFGLPADDSRANAIDHFDFHGRDQSIFHESCDRYFWAKIRQTSCAIPSSIRGFSSVLQSNGGSDKVKRFKNCFKSAEPLRSVNP